MLLALDTSTRVVGVALYNGVRVLSEASWLSHNHHTVELGPAVADALKKVGIENEALKAVGVAIGPGSFTGLRIGIALAKGLAYSRHLAVIGIPTMEILAAAQPVSNRRMAAVLEAGRRRLAVGWYQADSGYWKSTGELDNLTVDDFIERITRGTLVCGELGGELRERVTQKCKDAVLTSPAQSIRRPAFLAELAWKRWTAGRIDDPATLKPIYLHHGEPIPG